MKYFCQDINDHSVLNCSGPIYSFQVEKILKNLIYLNEKHEERTQKLIKLR